MTDEQTMQRVKEGDLSKAAILFERYHQRIYLYLGKMSGEYETAEDLTQNVFERLIHYRSSFDPSQKFENWVFRIAKNSFIDYSRSKSRMPLKFDADVAEINNIGDVQDTQEEQIEQLNKAMAALHDDDRELLILTRYEKKKYHEVASLLGTTESNIKVKVFRAIEKLRTHYFKLSTI
ncbi:MAG: sigma-70 family RNA polymerase sigma factor [Saprospiraceae bacterium]